MRCFPLAIKNINYNVSVVFVEKPKNIVVFSLTYELESFALFYGDFCMDLYSVDSDKNDEAMKQRDKALNTSSLQFLRSIKWFIATNFSQR